MTTKISARVGGLGIDARDKFEVQANATVTVGNGTTTGNIIVGTITAGTFNGISSNAITDSDTVVSINDPAITLASNGTDRIVVDSTQGVEVQVTGDLSVTGIFDLGSL
tara:strand:+ start:299 stop:625 length:327 start_codon:yes stop_codon:yes gene_type:complete